MMTPETLPSELERIGLAQFAPQIMAYLKPCIEISATEAGTWNAITDEIVDETPVGASKWGGHPDVPPDFQWPRVEEDPLPFLAQIQLEEIAPFDPENALPHYGLLLFFFDHTLEIQHETYVFHIEDATGLTRAAPPDNLPEFGVIEPYAMTFSRSWSLPASRSLEMLTLFQDCDDATIDAYGEWRHDQWTHQLLGHAFYYDHDDRPSAAALQDMNRLWVDESTAQQRQKWQEETEQWQVLLQLTSGGDSVNWGDAGSIYQLIRTDDLQQRCFERVCGFCQ